MSQYPVTQHLTEDTLALVADLRARGHSWESTAQEAGWEPVALRRAVRHAPEFERLYERAEREVRREAEAELLLVYRTQLRDTDPATAREAADALAKHIASERRDRTRLEVEQLRADTARARLEAKRAPADSDDTPPPASELAPEDVHRPESEAVYARRAADTQAVVWLWGGAHKIGGVEPDATTDVPLVLFSDDTVRGRRLFWAARYPLPTHPFDGPFGVPKPEPVPELTPEQVQQLGARAAATNDPSIPPAA